MPVIGLLSVASLDPYAFEMAAFRDGLQEAGYIDGQNVKIEYRWADGRYDLLPSMAAELVGRRVTVLAAVGGTRVGRAAMAANGRLSCRFRRVVRLPFDSRPHDRSRDRHDGPTTANPWCGGSMV